MAASNVSPEIRAAAIADLLTGDPPAEVARRYHLNRDLVNKWKQRAVRFVDTDTDTDMSATGADMSVSADTDPPPAASPVATSREIGALILDLLRAKLEASAAIAKAAKDPLWLASQSAADLAALGEYLDRSAFAVGDRLADRAAPAEE